jgi:hypothetical protein
MRFPRSVAVVLVALTAWLALPGRPALAGGAVFEFDHRYYVAGQVAIGHTTLSLHGTGSGRLRDGPYRAYLVPNNGWIHPPRVPPAAVPLGPVRMHRLGPGWLVRASVTFPVPHVAPGGYDVALCNTPCRDTIVGDLVGGWITVAASPEEARIRTIQDRFEAAQFRTVHRIDVQLRTLARERAAEERASRRLVTKLRAQVASLGTRLDAAEGSLRATPPPPRPERSMLEWLGWPVAGVLGLIAFALLVSRRRGRPEEPLGSTDGSLHADFDDGRELTGAGKR